MFRAFLLLCAVSALSGCTTLSPHSLPKCDGYARRPLNRAMRQWEHYRATGQETTSQRAMPSEPASAYFAEKTNQPPPAFARFDDARSYLPCTAR